MIYAEENSAALYAQGSDTCVVLLPGFGYTFDRPLLKRARELALQAGCDVLCLSFGELPIDRQRMKDSVAACLPIAHERAKAILDQLSYARQELRHHRGRHAAQGAGALCDAHPAAADLSLYP